MQKREVQCANFALLFFFRKEKKRNGQGCYLLSEPRRLDSIKPVGSFARGGGHAGSKLEQEGEERRAD